ncbi:MAG: hypothetical protein M1830_003976 [Pleopsidium flavum]|nr:MAG: hypothetical protein M1830_003976 [Pleopsidium flavum]
MGPKNQKGGVSNKLKIPEEEREDSLQAVVLADSYETRFRPYTLERPRCLLPLANTPLIEYTLEFLANAGVQEVFIYCGAHTDQLEEYLNASKWKTRSSPFTHITLLRSSATSIGDAMRDLDKRDLITGDFLVVSGDVVSNFPLESALDKHRARRGADKNAIMTMVLREAGTEHRTKPRVTRPAFVIDPTKERCLHYEQIRSDKGGYVNLDPELLATHQEIEIREDLIDCYIDICTPDVLGLWSDNFDYQTMRKSFLFGVLKDYELNGKTIHTHIVKDLYAARVRNLRAYDAVSRDVVSRWTYPFVPDSNLSKGQMFRFQRGNIYKEEGIGLARSSVVKRRTVIGRDTSIGDGSVVGDTVLGRRCQIGKNVTIDGAYIWDDAVVGDGSVVRKAVIANEAVVGRNCKIEPGALISYGVRIADGVNVPGTARITKTRSEGNETTKSDPDVVGKEGEGYNLNDDSDEDDEEGESIASLGLMYNLSNAATSDSSISTLNSDFSEEPRHFDNPRAESFATSISDENVDHDFHIDAAASIYDSLQRGDTADVIQLELMGLRMSANASDHQVRHAVVAAFMKRIANLVDTSSIGASEAVKMVIAKYKDLVERTIFEKAKKEKTDQVDFLLLMQKDLIHRKKGEMIMLFTVKELYDLEIVEEEGVEQWWEDTRSSDGEDMRSVRSQTEQFVDWLKNADEDSDDDEDDDEEDGSGDE